MASPRSRRHAHFSAEIEQRSPPRRASRPASPPPPRQPPQGILRPNPNSYRSSRARESRGRAHEDPPRSPSQPRTPPLQHSAAAAPPYIAPSAIPPAGQPLFVHQAEGVQPGFVSHPAQSYFGHPQFPQTAAQPHPFNIASTTVPGHSSSPNMSYENSAPPNMGVHFQPQVPDTTNGPYVHRYYPRHDAPGAMPQPYPVGAPVHYHYPHQQLPVIVTAPQPLVFCPTCRSYYAPPFCASTTLCPSGIQQCKFF